MDTYAATLFYVFICLTIHMNVNIHVYTLPFSHTAVGFADLCAVHSWSLEDNTQVPAPAGEAEREQDSWVGRLQGLGRKG